MSAGKADHVFERLLRPGSAIQLALLRIAVGLHLATLFYSQTFELLGAIAQEVPTQDASRTLIPAFLRQLFLNDFAPYVSATGVILSILLTLGFATRWVLPVLLALFLLAYDSYFQYTYLHYEWPYLSFVLLVLCFAPCWHRWSIDQLLATRFAKGIAPAPFGYRWPAEMIVVWLSLLYVSAGLAKLFPLRKGLIWLSGETSQIVFSQIYVHSPIYWLLGRPLFDYAHLLPFGLMNTAAVVLEIGCVTMLFTQRFHVFFIASIVLMHGMILMFGIPGFVQCAVVCCIALIPPEYFPDVPKTIASPSQPANLTKT
ncbi:MAG: hypothetical protein GC168_21260 [Candidatus Hydrogenedens sp.]|nr:hypothetical protein [Candidatus Hydrogenedens sp.]